MRWKLRSLRYELPVKTRKIKKPSGVPAPDGFSLFKNLRFEEKVQ